MNTIEKLSFFHELINCNYDMNIWSYNAGYHLVHSTSEEKDIIKRVGFQKNIEKHLSLGARTPLILETGLGLLWLAGFEFQDDILVGIHLIGTAFIEKDTPVVMLKRLNTYDLSVKLRATITRLLVDMPVIPTNTFATYGTMLHYVLNNEKILLNDISFSLSDKETKNKTLDMGTDEHNGIWINEQQLCKMFEDGNPNYKQALSASFHISSGLKIEIGDSLRRAKNNALVLLTLCSRSCIKGGLNPNVSYNLNDYYAALIEKSASMSEVTKICADMTDDYIQRVQATKNNSNITSLMQDTCYYILQHLTEPENLSIQTLAKRVGYTEYYFSHKFKKETGYSVNEFILKEKITQAKSLLSSTNQSIQDISDYLAFSNRSYFYSCFQKKVGISPTEYRKNSSYSASSDTK